jgi:hypothetical protein
MASESFNFAAADDRIIAREQFLVIRLKTFYSLNKSMVKLSQGLQPF